MTCGCRTLHTLSVQLVLCLSLFSHFLRTRRRNVTGILEYCRLKQMYQALLLIHESLSMDVEELEHY